MIPAESSSQFEEHLQAALSLELHYADHIHRDFRAGGQVRAIPASVLVLLGYSKESFNSDLFPSLLYTRRTQEVDTHKGQIAFPGGHAEPEELGQPEITALRETEEEVGISRAHVKLMGRLPSLFTGTGYLIQPFVGMLDRFLEETSLVLDPQETAEAIWAPLQSLISPGTYQAQTFRVGNLDYPIDVYQYQNYRIWGATGSMTKNLLDRLERVGIFLRA